MPDVFEVAAGLGWPDYESERAVATQVAATPGARRSLGRLGELAGWLAGVQSSCPPRDPQRVVAVVVAADHGIAAAGVTASSPAGTAGQLARIADGSAPVSVLAGVVGARVVVVDAGTDTDSCPGTPDRRVRRGSGRIDVEDALSKDDTRAAVELGMSIAREQLEAGTDLLVAGAVGAGATTAAATLVSVLTGTEPTRVTGRGSGIDDTGWMRKATAVRDARRRAVPHRAAPLDLLATAGGVDLAVLVGLLLRVAAAGVPIVVDGPVAATAALLARELQPRSVRWMQAGPATGDPAHGAALRNLGLGPLLDLPADPTLPAGAAGLATGDGSGGLLCVPVLRAAARLAAALPQPDPAPGDATAPG